MVINIFEELKVVEVASVLAGPSVGMFFAELGAEVIKIEHRSGGGDVTRRWKTPEEESDSPVSAYYASVNWGKTVRFLDLDQEEDYRVLCREIENADIFISNLKPASARRMQLDPETLTGYNSKLIYAQLTSYPSDINRPAFDVVLQAETGYMAMTGHPHGPPVRMPVAMIDVLAAHQLKESILVALFLRQKDGIGRVVQSSLYEAALSGLVNQASNYLMTGHVPQPMGSAHPNIAPYGDAFQDKEGKWLVLAVGSDQQFIDLCALLDCKDLVEDDRYNNNLQRVRNRSSLCESLQEAIKTWDVNDLDKALRESGVPAGRIRNMEEVFTDSDAQAMILEEENTGENITRRIASAAFVVRAI